MHLICESRQRHSIRNIIRQIRQLLAFGSFVVSRTGGRSSHSPIPPKTSWNVHSRSIFSKGTLILRTDVMTRRGARLRRREPVAAKPRTSFHTKLNRLVCGGTMVDRRQRHNFLSGIVVPLPNDQLSCCASRCRARCKNHNALGSRSAASNNRSARLAGAAKH